MPRDVVECDLNAFDDYTHKHSVQVTLLGLLIARRAWQTDGWIDYRGHRRFDRIDDRMRKLGLWLLVHDVGTLAVPPEILNKPGRLTDPEMEIMKTHAVAGVELLRPADLSPLSLSVVRDHHERVDGSGYPESLFGGQVARRAAARRCEGHPLRVRHPVLPRRRPPFSRRRHDGRARRGRLEQPRTLVLGCGPPGRLALARRVVGR